MPDALLCHRSEHQALDPAACPPRATSAVSEAQIRAFAALAWTACTSTAISSSHSGLLGGQGGGLELEHARNDGLGTSSGRQLRVPSTRPGGRAAWRRADQHPGQPRAPRQRRTGAVVPDHHPSVGQHPRLPRGTASSTAHHGARTAKACAWGWVRSLPTWNGEHHDGVLERPENVPFVGISSSSIAATVASSVLFRG